MIQKFSTGFLREQCDRADPNTIDYNSTEQGNLSMNSPYLMQTHSNQPLREVMNFITQVAIDIKADNSMYTIYHNRDCLNHHL